MHFCIRCGNLIYPGQKSRRVARGRYHLLPDCEHAKAMSAPAPLVWEDEVRFHTSHYPRLLGNRISTSEVDRRCYYCEGYEESYIFSGEEYERETWLVPVGEYWERRTAIEIRFKHFPSCPLPFDDFDEDYGRCELVLMKKKHSRAPAPLRRAA